LRFFFVEDVTTFAILFGTSADVQIIGETALKGRMGEIITVVYVLR